MYLTNYMTLCGTLLTRWSHHRKGHKVSKTEKVYHLGSLNAFIQAHLSWSILFHRYVMKTALANMFGQAEIASLDAKVYFSDIDHIFCQ